MFDRNKHVYDNPAFIEFVKDAIRFFNGTPVHTAPLQRFTGVGVYALYYTGSDPLYRPYAAQNRLSYAAPIYCGKAVPAGWRQGRAGATGASTELSGRLSEHYRSIDAVGLPTTDFYCRFCIFEEDCADLIGTVEAALIKHYLPLWNTEVDGFGNHDPGSGRYGQARSDWDVLHPGRPWAARCTGAASPIGDVQARVQAFYRRRGWI